MKVKKTKTGRVMVQATLGTLKIGQSWKLSPEAYSVGYLRVSCSLYGNAVNKSFTVSYSPLSGDSHIIITRTA